MTDDDPEEPLCTYIQCAYIFLPRPVSVRRRSRGPQTESRSVTLGVLVIYQGTHCIDGITGVRVQVIGVTSPYAI